MAHYDKNSLEWVDYEGSDPIAIESISLINDAKAPIFNLNCVRLKEPRKGINIVDGKKVLKH